MLYEIQHGAREEKRIERALARGKPLPKAIAGAPEIPVGLELYLEAFWELSSCRSMGWGPGPIPWSVVREWGETFGLEEEQQEDLVYFIRQMDRAYLEEKAAQMKREEKGPSNGG